MNRRFQNTYKLTTAGLLLAVGLILPYTTSHAFGIAGTVLLPMHIPVLLCGLLCGPLYGGALGVVTPLLSCILTGMPVAFPMLPIMMGELFTYGVVSGSLMYKTKLGSMKLGVYAALLIAMCCGRVTYALIFYALSGAFGQLRALSMPAAVATGLPGIIIQIALLPPIVKAAERMPGHRKCTSRESAINLVKGGTSCVLMKDYEITKTASGKGLRPLIQFYENGDLSGAYVVDKVIGKAAAMVLALGGVSGCYGVLMSKPAEEFLRSHGVACACGTLVENILNQNQDDLCPMERAVAEAGEAEAALEAARAMAARTQAG